jgi:hypothetical protein
MDLQKVGGGRSQHLQLRAYAQSKQVTAVDTEVKNNVSL